MSQQNITNLPETGIYPIMEHFYTIQGEGYWSGTPAYFIRIGGCDVGCSWCDVKDSWSFEGHEYYHTDEIFNFVKESGAKHIVVTGGEPAMYDLKPLTKKAQEMGLKIHIETSGVYDFEGNWHWICLSPKKFKTPSFGIHERANELKVIVLNKTDFVFAEEHASKVSSDCRLYLQPEWSKRETIMPKLVEYVKNNPQWKISLQTHKYLNIP